MKYIQLTKGEFAVVDDADFNRVSAFSWVMGQRVAQRNVRVNGKRKTWLMHWDILPPKKGYENDHINGNPLDNRRCNLRYVTHAQNMKNVGKQRTPALSKFKGVSTNYYRWRSRITVNGKVIMLGNFKTQEEAAKAYDIACQKFHGEFARPNRLDSLPSMRDTNDTAG